MNNYGTLSSDYDAGYDDGRAEAFESALDSDPHSEDDSLVWLLVRKSDIDNSGVVLPVSETA